jgi:tRNA-specific 2-thiouridylase
MIKDTNLIGIEKISQPMQATIKIRYNDEGHPGVIFPENDHKLRIEFLSPQKSVTPGQSAVFFADDVVIGGGIIDQRINEGEKTV